jgi:hypothetical protein
MAIERKSVANIGVELKEEVKLFLTDVNPTLADKSTMKTGCATFLT